MSMVGSTATLPERTRPLALAWVRAAAFCSMIALLVVGSALVARRAAGAFTTHLATSSLLATVMLTGLVVLGGRAAWRLAGPRCNPEQLRFREQFIGWGGTLAAALMFFGASFPSFAYWNWLCWLPLIVADYLQRDWFFDSAPRGWTPRLIDHEAGLAPGRPRGGSVEPPAVLPLGEETREHDPLFEHEVDDDSRSADLSVEALNANVLQQFTRIRDESGVESIFGSLRAEFVSEQRHATLHVGFCPPLADIPAIEAEPVAGPDAAVKVVQAFCHGARLEVRLAEATPRPGSVVVEFSATARGVTQ